MLDYPVLRVVIARKKMYGDEASRNEGEMMEQELEMILAALKAAQQIVQSDGAEALQFCEICQSWHGKQHITTRDVSPCR